MTELLEELLGLFVAALNLGTSRRRVRLFPVAVGSRYSASLCPDVLTTEG